MTTETSRPDPPVGPTIALIPARGGSKSVPRKNLVLLDGMPLLAHTIEHAKDAATVDRVIVSTNDDETAEVAVAFGAEVIRRPDDISTDTAPSEAAIVHALDHLEENEGIVPSIIVFLQCTSPLRRAEDIDAAVAQFARDDADSLLSVSYTHRFLWEIREGVPRSINYDHHRRQRRQDMGRQYMENGSIYVFRPWVIRKHNNRLGGKISLYTMSENTGWDIDSRLDFDLVGHIFSAWKKGEIVLYPDADTDPETGPE